ncbi:glycosyl transferase family protein [Polymorphobacter fuscus]|uniref:Glycosyl transferase family protein n=1 Tax=Sandarakinorhabdus fusca TaxID=1439888 RepID=A0A7C9GR06_9SPHN|nr:glycosyl transferase family protein [Polymorphobacter fuscus]KAB7644840.1 glycosyl transferase family protein [Polymorphobacter fuscus]MQT18116.1 glycosyl transferase family protein [Polymorphobacter fuscus]NJC09434.1 adsorption protein B [Polymorphobacter fuscus]
MADAGGEWGLAALVAGHLLLGELVLVIALIIAVSAADDLFVDLVYFGRWLWRRMQPPTPRATAEMLHQVAPAPMAIIIPAWDESNVIGAMLARLLATLDYPDYRVFVGLYPNDPAGRAAVAAIPDARIAPVLCSRPGPTTKSDCLNHLWRAVLADERARGRIFKAVVLHDAEDVLHPQELRVQNALIPGLAMVQLPVVPLPDKTSPWVAGHYLDEFAANHLKDIAVRQALGAAVPSAGVACAIERTMLGRIAEVGGGDPFDATCLTEDYELGLRIKALGGGTALVRVREANGGLVATEAHFPATFETARRQKTRWLLGIALSGWDRLGWPRGAADRYMLLRDRKAVVAALLAMVAYAVTLLILLDSVLVASVPALAALPPLLGPLAMTLTLVNIVLLAWRLAMRAACTAYGHGWREAARSVPRAVVSNVINAAAAWSACRRYAAALRSGDAPQWDKTVHRFPHPEAESAA